MNHIKTIPSMEASYSKSAEDSKIVESENSLSSWNNSIDSKDVDLLSDIATKMSTDCRALNRDSVIPK